MRHLQAQYSERDGERRRVVPGILGIFGHGNVCGIGQALSEFGEDLPFVQPKHEQAMVHTALGYAKATRRLATLACTASIGPGATNLVTGAATATTNRLPVLLLPGDTFVNRRQGVVLQQLEHPNYADWAVNETLRPVSRFFDRIARPEQLLTALPEAMRVLLDPAETGAVTVALHQDVQGEAWDWPDTFFADRTWTVRRPPPEPGAVSAAAQLLRSARRPLVVVGGGVVHSAAETELTDFAERHGLPVAETSAGKGASAASLTLGGIGVNGTRAATALAGDADVVLCIGTRLSDFTTGSQSLFQHDDVRFVGLNVTSADAHKLGALPLVADAREGLRALGAELGDYRSPAARVAQAEAELDRWRDALEADLAPRDGERLTQGQALRALEATAAAGDWIVAAAGGPPGDLLKGWSVAPGARAHIEFAFSCMGHEIPAALGIRMAEPDAGQVVAVIGDGTFLMAPTELVTAVQEELDVTILLLVNGGYQSIHGLQDGAGLPSLGTEFRQRRGATVEVDYAANARSVGCTVFEVEDLDSLQAALERTRGERGPCVVVCHVEPRRALLGSGAFWDLGVPEHSGDPRVREASRRHRSAAAKQRLHLRAGR